MKNGIGRCLVMVLSVYACAIAMAQDHAATTPSQAQEGHHSWAKRRGHPSPDGTKGVGPPPLAGFAAGKTVTVADYACRAAAVVIGQIGPAEPVATADGALIFTEYPLSASAVLKGVAPSLVTRVGGEFSAMRSRGPRTRLRSFRSSLLPLLVPGENYLLFLSSVRGSEALAADFPGGTLRLVNGGAAEQVDGVGFVKGVPKSGQAMPLTTVVAAINTALAAGCQR